MSQAPIVPCEHTVDNDLFYRAAAARPSNRRRARIIRIGEYIAIARRDIVNLRSAVDIEIPPVLASHLKFLITKFRICLPGQKGRKHRVLKRGWTKVRICFKVSFVSQSQVAEPNCPDQRVAAATAPDRGTAGSVTAREAAFGGRKRALAGREYTLAEGFGSGAACCQASGGSVFAREAEESTEIPRTQVRQTVRQTSPPANSGSCRRTDRRAGSRQMPRVQRNTDGGEDRATVSGRDRAEHVDTAV